MTGRALPMTGLALVLAGVPTVVGFAAAALPWGLPLSSILAMFIAVMGPGLLTLAVLVFWRLHTGASRPGWPFLFTVSGAVNLLVWTVISIAEPFAPPPDAAASYVDGTTFHIYATFAATLLWSMLGGVFGWLLKRAPDSRVMR